MRSVSLRTWLLFVSILFAVVGVGAIALTSYVIVTDGMQEAAREAALRVASTAGRVVNEQVGESEASATAAGMTGPRADAAAYDAMLARLPAVLAETGPSNVEYALYDAQLQDVWSTGAQALAPQQQSARVRALKTGEVATSPGIRGNLVAGLLSKAQLGVSVVHVPVKLSNRAAGILDVTYAPLAEERTIDAIRLPMTVLALTAMLILVALMQSSMVWVLNLVDNLRRAADSIDAGRLDERLPDMGSNEIGELATSINSLIERLQRRAEAQSRFVADASHELATPVAGIRGYTSILRGWGAEDPVVRAEAIDAIDRESRRMARLTGDLLNLLHADQGLVLKSLRFDVNTLIRERIAVSANRWIDKDIEYIGPPATWMMMQGDPDRVEDVVSILLDNASKYTPAGGRVTVGTSRRRETVTIEVSDTGQGIPPEDLPRVFDRFYRSEASRAAGEGGFGLGLAIAQNIVASMGGTISVESRVGVGTRFTVRLPRGRM